MTAGSILLGVALLILVGLFIVRPFLRPQEREAAPSQRQQLLQQKEALLDQIQALDFDRETGKIPTKLHEYQREQLMRQATAVLQALDTTAVIDPNLEKEIEAAVARLRQQSVATPANNGKARFCAQCGKVAASDDKFCTHCGTNLTQTAAAKPT